MSNISGISAYQQMNQNWKTNKTSQKDATKQSSKTAPVADEKIQTQSWKPIDTSSSLVPVAKEGYGLSIGEVQLSDEAKSYYEELKNKFSGAQFILVSKDMKSQVQANAAAYGNANKMVVLIDEEKLEMMANDESFRKKYEGIISMAQSQMAAAKDSLASTGANVKNYGISVGADGSMKYFATLEKATQAQSKRIEKKREERRKDRVEENKKANKEQQRKRTTDAKTQDVEPKEEQEYVLFTAKSPERLYDKVAAYAYDNLTNSVRTQEERNRGQNIDFAG
ncbi:DUF6033 family protein [Eubacterium oxidoreducens]|uniref:Uncharacterized protein n=1 Tax=Eubacterium oxidoreducens TaxID=1732 RepID=A0A1G6AUQ0_EUBOX|nr:DUF6033 family protein [Eubacterium oxidoreducens]SDB12100.1 hypothetical protein SAMN02910417_00906 [Eubacterium oxidoreducens]